jgi:hypothetical protein
MKTMPVAYVSQAARQMARLSLSLLLSLSILL